MKLIFLFLIVCTSVQTGFAQHPPVNRKQFFLGDSTINVQFTTDIKKLRTNKRKPVWQPAHIVMRFPDSNTIEENIRVEPRGVYRKENCDLASLMFDFKTPSSPLLSDLKKLKLVGGCHLNSYDEELLLKEYIAYKIYNFLSPMSFRVRLLHVTYNDSAQKVKSYTQYAFLIEDIEDLAKRNKCKEVKKRTYATDATDRKQATVMYIYQYMIGNTDWSVPNYHNIKLLVPLTDTFARPYPIPYDFDYSGLVDAPYAVPDENLEIKNVSERYYRGYQRSMEELKPIVSVFKEKKDSIIQYINNFDLLKPNARKNIVNYLEQFYDRIETDGDIKTFFIFNANK
jgi:hypothetical protein